MIINIDIRWIPKQSADFSFSLKLGFDLYRVKSNIAWILRVDLFLIELTCMWQK